MAEDLHDQDKVQHGRFAQLLKAKGTFADKTGGEVDYKLQHVGGGLAVMTVAGVLSGLLGIGSGALKVIYFSCSALSWRSLDRARHELFLL
jgi:hypothetical protein